jgi:seryl-tRNA synthetase
VTRTIEEIESDLAQRLAERNLPDTQTSVLEAELAAARNNEAVAERIVMQKGWVAMQQDEAQRCRLNLEQLRFLVSEAEKEIARLTTTGNELNSKMLTASAAVSAAIAAGDVATAARCQADVNSNGQALATIPPLLNAAQANRDTAAAQIPAAARELELPMAHIRNAEAEITHLSGLPDGQAWDEPHPAPHKEAPSLLGLGTEMALRTRIADNAELLKSGRVRFDGEPRVGDRGRPRVRRRAR